MQFFGRLGKSTGKWGRGEHFEILNLATEQLGRKPMFILETEEDYATKLCNMDLNELNTTLSSIFLDMFKKTSPILNLKPFCFHIDPHIQGGIFNPYSTFR